MGEEEGGGRIFVPISPFGGPSGNVVVTPGGNAQEVEQLDHLDQEAEEAAAVVADASYPATPIGRRGSPMNVPRGTNSCTDIQGRTYTGHALDQMQGRGIPPSVVEDTIATGNQSPSYDDATVFDTNQARVVLNPDGSVKTVITR